MPTYRSIAGFLLMTFTLLACAQPPVMIDRVLVNNATNTKITDVRVKHKPTNKFGAVNLILPGHALDIGLPGEGRPMQARHATVMWRDQLGRDWSVDLNLPYDRVTAREKWPVSLVYSIIGNGEVSVSLESTMRMP